eukprot:gene8565-8657_t
MHKTAKALIVFAMLALPTAAFAGHSDLTVPPADTFLLGGDQGAAMMVSGKNLGQTGVTISARTGKTEVTIAQVAPGESFQHSFAMGEVAAIGNTSTTQAARLSVDFTGSASSLSMRYALPQKD